VAADCASVAHAIRLKNLMGPCAASPASRSGLNDSHPRVQMAHVPITTKEIIMEEYDPDIYSNVSVGGKPLTWRELCDEQIKEIHKLSHFKRMVTDLDRNENGRHEGDADVGDPTGVSQGNPKLKTGDILGYSISGEPYIMPERGKRYDSKAWIKNYE